MCSKINECYIFVCILFEICQTRTSKFRRVIRQHTDGMLGSIIWILLEIHFSFQAWKSFENPLKMTKLSPWVWCTTFWDTVQNGVLTRWFKNFYMFCRFDRIPACDRRTDGQTSFDSIVRARAVKSVLWPPTLSVIFILLTGNCTVIHLSAELSIRLLLNLTA